MKDYQKHLDEYDNFPETRAVVESYLDRYWLDKSEFNGLWKNIMNNIFCSPLDFPSYVIKKELDVFVTGGGLVLYEKSFRSLIACMKITGDKYFVIVEDYDENNPPHTDGSQYRLKYPADVTWEEIMSGTSLSVQVFRRPVRNYFIFGDSGQWGKYVGNDYPWPLDITGFNKKYSDLFHNNFKNTQNTIKDLKEWFEYYKVKPYGIE